MDLRQKNLAEYKYMIIGPKYKIARRLGAPVFEKTQTQKYALSQARREKTRRSFSRPKSEYGLQLLEKQKARFTYGMTEKQFSKYAKNALASKDVSGVSKLYTNLEMRADNIVYRSGFASTRMAARQMVSHGHITLNGKRITIPSMLLKVGDSVSIRDASQKKPLFLTLDERLNAVNRPSWISFDIGTKTAKIQGVPKYEPHECLFDLKAVLEFYSR
jgi:small subunit ribosomal protein S4